MTNIKTYWAETQVQGSKMRLYVARPETDEKRPAILVFQEAFGVNAYMRSVTERIAAEGYYAVAPELFHRTGQGFEGSYNDYDAIKPHTSAITTESLTADIQAAYAFLQAQPEADAHRTSCIGFCMGGRVSVIASMVLPVRASISFYGGNIPNTIGERLNEVNCPLLMFWGGLDKHIGKDVTRFITDKLDEGEKDYTNVVFSKADHGFFCDVRSSYNPTASTEAWAMVKAFWNDHL